MHSEMNGTDKVGLEPPKITSYSVSMESFGAYMEEKRANQCRGLRDQFLVRGEEPEIEEGRRRGMGEERERV